MPIAPGTNVAVLARVLGIWYLNACRIVYVIDETGPIETYGFAYGTLPDHAEKGEERFSVVWDHADDSVRYEQFAFSRPNYISHAAQLSSRPHRPEALRQGRTGRDATRRRYGSTDERRDHLRNPLDQHRQRVADIASGWRDVPLSAHRPHAGHGDGGQPSRRAVDAVFSSDLRRAVETAEIAFPEACRSSPTAAFASPITGR